MKKKPMQRGAVRNATTTPNYTDETEVAASTAQYHVTWHISCCHSALYKIEAGSTNETNRRTCPYEYPIDLTEGPDRDP